MKLESRIAREADFRTAVAMSNEALSVCLAGLSDVIRGPRSSCFVARRPWPVLWAAAAEVDSLQESIVQPHSGHSHVVVLMTQ
jgi:hypothetical protein